MVRSALPTPSFSLTGSDMEAVRGNGKPPIGKCEASQTVKRLPPAPRLCREPTRPTAPTQLCAYAILSLTGVGLPYMLIGQVQASWRQERDHAPRTECRWGPGPIPVCAAPLRAVQAVRYRQQILEALFHRDLASLHLLQLAPVQRRQLRATTHPEGRLPTRPCTSGGGPKCAGNDVMRTPQQK